MRTQTSITIANHTGEQLAMLVRSARGRGTDDGALNALEGSSVAEGEERTHTLSPAATGDARLFVDLVGHRTGRTLGTLTLDQPARLRAMPRGDRGACANVMSRCADIVTWVTVHRSVTAQAELRKIRLMLVTAEHGFALAKSRSPSKARTPAPRRERAAGDPAAPAPCLFETGSPAPCEPLSWLLKRRPATA